MAVTYSKNCTLNITWNIFTRSMYGDTELYWYFPDQPAADITGFTYRGRYGALFMEQHQIAVTPLFNIDVQYLGLTAEGHKVRLRFAPSADLLGHRQVEGFRLSPGAVEVLEAQFFRDTTTYPFTIKLRSENSPYGFYVEQDMYNFELRAGRGDKAEGEIKVVKGGSFDLSVVAPEGFSIVRETEGENREKIRFLAPSSAFPMGPSQKEIVVSNGQGARQVVKVIVNQVRELEYPEAEVHFCLDKELLRLSRQQPQGKYVRINLKFYSYFYGKNKRVEADYDFAFFQGEVAIDIGSIVQDFFDGIPSLDVLFLNTSRTVVPHNLYSAAKVDLFITERGQHGLIQKSYELKGLRYLPGKKPRCYPYLTEATLRSTYPESLVSVSALARDFKSQQLTKIASNSTDYRQLGEDFNVANISFLRSVADEVYNQQAIITHKGLKLEPKPAGNDKPIMAIFENQNQCPDWFSFSGEWESHMSYQHQLQEHLIAREHAKSKVTAKRTFRLSTGWIFAEEIALLWELVRSPLCYLYLDIGAMGFAVDKSGSSPAWVKVLPISEKPLSYDSTRSVHSFVVEFQLAEIE